MLFVAIVCAQCFSSGYMSSQKETKPVPIWMKYMIDLSLLKPLFGDGEDNVYDKGDGHVSNAMHAENDGIAMKQIGGRDMTGEASCIDTENGVRKRNIGDSQASTTDNTGKGMDHVPTTTADPKYSWQRGSRAFDRLCRVIIPVCFVIVVAVELSSVS